MEKAAFYDLLAEITGGEPGSIGEGTALKGLKEWDSLAVVQFIAAADEHFGVTFPVKQIAACGTVQDLVNLLGDRIN